jgi:predicted MPP superfamily phosphohydrolase
VRDALGALLDVPGVYVFGSNDYFSPTLRNPLRYVLPDDGRRNTRSARLPWTDLRDAFSAAGWVELTNRRELVKVGELSLAFAGVDDPHLGYDRLAEVAGPADPHADVRLGVAHAPYLRVLDQFAADGYDAILAGHTHGGQVCVPGVGALTTNCDLDPAAPRGCTATRPTRATATRARRGCTSRPGSAPRRTPRSGSPAARRPRC